MHTLLSRCTLKNRKSKKIPSTPFAFTINVGCVQLTRYAIDKRIYIYIYNMFSVLYRFKLFVLIKIHTSLRVLCVQWNLCVVDISDLRGITKHPHDEGKSWSILYVHILCTKNTVVQYTFIHVKIGITFITYAYVFVIIYKKFIIMHLYLLFKCVLKNYVGIYSTRVNILNRKNI